MEVSDNHRIEMTTDLNGVVTMTIINSQRDDEGTYRCKAENEEGIASTTGYVTITGVCCVHTNPFEHLYKQKQIIECQ